MGDIVTRETCNHYSLNINILGKMAVLHFALVLFCGWGHAKLSLKLIGHNYACSLLHLGLCQTQLQII
jgi:hypothetical protein